MPLISLANLSRFLGKVKDYVDSKAGIAGATGSEFAQKSIESQPNMTYDATSTDGINYTATIPGVTSLYAGLKIKVKLSRTTASTMPKLNVNSLGAKGIRQQLTNNNISTAPGALNTWINASCPVEMTYTGSQWVVHYARPSAAYLYGSVPVTGGGTGATTAEEARTNLGAASLEYVQSEIARLEALINNGN